MLKLTLHEENEPLLHKQCRDYGNAEFEYFMTHLMPHMNPRISRYKTKAQQCERLMSTAFTSSDEAYGLLVLDNELHVWDKQIELKRKYGRYDRKANPQLTKKYVKLYQKSECGWTRKGIGIYKMLENEVHGIRTNKHDEEMKYMKKFQMNTKGWKQKKSEVNNDSDSDGYYEKMCESMMFRGEECLRKCEETADLPVDINIKTM